MRDHTPFGVLELLAGIMLVLVGMLAIFFPDQAVTTFVVTFGLVTVITGIANIGFYCFFKRHATWGAATSLASGAVNILMGLFLLLGIGAATAAISVVFPLWLIFSCGIRLVNYRLLRQIGTGYYLLMLVTCTVGLILGGYLLLNPVISGDAFAYFAGAYLILAGGASIATARSDLGRYRPNSRHGYR